MKLTRKISIALCIEVWTWCAETGKQKYEWPKWRNNGGSYRYITLHCFFCEYDRQRRQRTHKKRCYHCPFEGPERACVKNYYYGKWEDAKTPKTRKKYAKLFLEQIKTIK